MTRAIFFVFLVMLIGVSVGAQQFAGQEAQGSFSLLPSDISGAAPTSTLYGYSLSPTQSMAPAWIAPTNLGIAAAALASDQDDGPLMTPSGEPVIRAFDRRD